MRYRRFGVMHGVYRNLFGVPPMEVRLSRGVRSLGFATDDSASVVKGAEYGNG